MEVTMGPRAENAADVLDHPVGESELKEGLQRWGSTLLCGHEEVMGEPCVFRALSELRFGLPGKWASLWPMCVPPVRRRHSSGLVCGMIHAACSCLRLAQSLHKELM